jgi:hypothetical protein
VCQNLKLINFNRILNYFFTKCSSLYRFFLLGIETLRHFDISIFNFLKGTPKKSIFLTCVPAKCYFNEHYKNQTKHVDLVQSGLMPSDQVTFTEKMMSTCCLMSSDQVTFTEKMMSTCCLMSSDQVHWEDDVHFELDQHA